MEKGKMKKIGAIVLDVVLYIFLAVALLAVILSVFSKKDADGAAEVFGYQMRVVTSDSMGASEHTDVSTYSIKSIPVRSLVFVKLMPEDPAEADQWYGSLREGDVLTFRYVYTTQVTITHRITKITEQKTGGYLIELAGDNKNSETGQLVQVIDTAVPNNPNHVIGKVTGQAYLLGAIVSLLMQPAGTVLLIILPCAIIILLEVIKVLKTLTEEKKEQQRQQQEEKDNELEELRRKLAELEGREKAADHTESKEEEK